MSEYAKYMDDAWRLHTRAERQLNWWRITDEEADLRVAAEIAWDAVSLAACVLLESRGVAPPPERRARYYALYFMEKERPDIRARKMAVRLGGIGSELHRDCFYDGECPPKYIVRSVTVDAREFLEDVAALTNGAKPAASEKASDARVHG